MYKICLIQKGDIELILKSLEVAYPVNLSMLMPFQADIESTMQLILKDHNGNELFKLGIPPEKSFLSWDAIEGFYNQRENLIIGNDLNKTHAKIVGENNEKTIHYITENKWRVRIFLFAIGMLTISLLTRGIKDIAKGQGLAVFSGASLLIMMVLLLVFIGIIVRRFTFDKKE